MLAHSDKSPTPTQLTRREFLRVVSIAFPAALFGACAPKPIPAAEVPPATTVAPTERPPTATPSAVPPTESVNPAAPEMILIEPGSFEMGSTDGRVDEQPVHTVRIARPFLLGKYELTFDEYDRFCQETGSPRAGDAGFGRGKVPVQNVDWYGAAAFCNWLSEKQGLTPCYSGKGKGTQCDFSADGYRLPTEAEWEYAARGGQAGQGGAFSGSSDPAEVGWYEANSGGRTHEVGEKAPNELGLYDMSGNVFEWCWDWYAADYYASSPVDDPLGPPPPSSLKPWELLRSRRSGCWRENAKSIRTATRSYDTASYAGENGFRLARTA